MDKKRIEVENFIISTIEKITNDSSNTNIYKEYFSSLSDAAFKQWIDDLEHNRSNLVIYAPNFSNIKITIKNNIEIAKSLGHTFFEKLWIGPTSTQRAYLTPVEYMIVDLPIRRPSQILMKKISTAEHNRTIDIYTNQPVGDSESAKISYPELQMLTVFGLDSSLIELFKYRGGDKKGFNAMNAIISKYGSVNLKLLKPYAGGVESTRTLNTFLTCMHIKANL